MRATLFCADGRTLPIADLSKISDLLESSENSFVWADAADPKDEDFALLQQEFSLHPLAVEDAINAHQRSKIEAYDTFWFIVVHGVAEKAGKLTQSETSIFAGERFVVTCRHGEPFDVAEVERRFEQLKGLRRDSGAFVYTILDTIVDGYVPIVQRFEQRADTLEERVMRPSSRDAFSNDALVRILQIRKALQLMRHIVAPVQDIVLRIRREGSRVFSPDEMVYYQDIGDHILRLLSQIDSLSDVIATSLAINASLSANRQAQISRQLTIIATVFLPLSFITGFFGQNFGFLVRHIDSEQSFWLFGVVVQLTAVAILFMYFARRRWL